MHPAPSIIAFTTLSGLGLGLLALLGLGVVVPSGLLAFVWFGLGYGLTLAGLAASALHLGHPERALRAFSQWPTSWLSREAVLAAAALLVMAPYAAGLVFWGHALPLLGALGAVLCLMTVLATGMIYTQLRTVPRWNHWTTPLVFLTAALTGGALLGAQVMLAQMLLPWLALALVLNWLLGDKQFSRRGATLGTATGLGGLGTVRLLEPPHTGSNYLLKEMVYVVARRHALKLRAIALVLACIAPALLLCGDYDAESRLSDIIRFMNRVEARTGVVPVAYLENSQHLKLLLGNAAPETKAKLRRAPYWAALYSNSSGAGPVFPAPVTPEGLARQYNVWSNWSLWQYGGVDWQNRRSQAKVYSHPGGRSFPTYFGDIDRPLERNLFNGSFGEMTAFWKRHGLKL